MVAEESADASALRRVFRSAVPSADPARVADEVERSWSTSSAWVQMIACGPPAMTTQRALVSSAGSLLPVAS